MTPVEHTDVMAPASESDASTASTTDTTQGSNRLSYKFQRLRERLRKAVESGELSGKLPGERELAKRFNANPKTLSKALTDLAAEGLLDRSIGRGTYVKGTAPQASATDQKWLILVDRHEDQAGLVEQIQRLHPDSEVATETTGMRPSFLNQFQAVIELSSRTPEAFHRSLLVRGVPVMRIGHEPGSFKVHAALLDRAYAAACLARDLFLAGHRRVLVIETGADTTVSDAVKTAAQRYLPHAAVERCNARDVQTIGDRTCSAILCDGEPAAQAVRDLTPSFPHLQRTALAALGMTQGQPACTGIYVTASELATAATELLAEAQVHKPAVLWLTGTYVERGTIRAVPEARFETPAAEVA